MAADDVRADNEQLAVAVLAQQQHLDRVAEIIVIELLVLDAVQLHRRFRRHHEIERRAQRTPVLERRRQAARRDHQVALIGLAHEAAGRVRLELEQRPDLVGGHVVGHGLGGIYEGLRLGFHRPCLRKRGRERRRAGKRRLEKVAAA